MYIFIICIILTQLETCHAYCTCTCYIFKVFGTDAPRSVWKKIKPERVERENCIEVKFVSSNPNSSVCLIQVHNISSAGDQNLELVVMDGPKEVFILTHSSPWMKREYCSSSNSLAFLLKKLNSQSEVQMDLMNIDFSVLHIESRSRRVYMLENYCDETFIFRNSEVNVFNKFPFPTQTSPSQYCSVNLFKATNESTQFCLAYTLSHPRNNSEEVTWKIYVTTTDSSNEHRDDLYTIEANRSDNGGWCDSHKRSSITITYYVILNEDPLLEPPLITMLVRDFSGGVINFIAYIRGISASTMIARSTEDEATLALAASLNTQSWVPLDERTPKGVQNAETTLPSSSSSRVLRPGNVSFSTSENQRPTTSGSAHSASPASSDNSTSVSSKSSTAISERYLIPDRYTFTLLIYSLVLGTTILVVLSALICILRCQKKSAKERDQKLKPKPPPAPKGKK